MPGRIGPKRLYRRPVLATRTPLAQARGGAGKQPKRAKNIAAGRFRGDPVPDLPGGPERFANHASNLIDLARVVRMLRI
jgi:hypothetical protein